MTEFGVNGRPVGAVGHLSPASGTRQGQRAAAAAGDLFRPVPGGASHRPPPARAAVSWTRASSDTLYSTRKYAASAVRSSSAPGSLGRRALNAPEMPGNPAGRSGRNGLVMAFAQASTRARSSGECVANFSSQSHTRRPATRASGL